MKRRFPPVRGAKITPSAAIIVLLVLPLACLFQGGMPPHSPDFTTSGFINDDCYQVIAREAPDPRAQGLVERRESSYFRAREAIVPAAVTRLTDYRASFLASVKNGKGAEEIKRNRTYYGSLIRKICGEGRISEEFYEDDDSVVLVYRICRKGLKKEIESLPPST